MLYSVDPGGCTFTMREQPSPHDFKSHNYVAGFTGADKPVTIDKAHHFLYGRGANVGRYQKTPYCKLEYTKVVHLQCL